MEFLGFEFRRKGTVEKQDLDEIIPKQNDDGSLVVAAGGSYGTVVDLEGAAKNESELVTKYREMALHPEVDSAIDDIVNEVIVSEDEETVMINLDNLTNLPKTVKTAIEQEFDNVKSLFDFEHQGYDIFRRWYVDGRLYYHAIIDKKDPAAGIQEMRYIDPRKIKKIKEVKRKRVNDSNRSGAVTLPAGENEYFIYNEKGFGGKPTTGPASNADTTGLKIAKDSIVYCTSGLLDKSNALVISHLHKAIKPLNQLRALEDATVIYRISRAPERKIFYIDVGNLPKMKAEQYLRDMMVRYKNKVVYDASTGEVRDDRKFMTMLEDYWLPRREGNRGTQIETLPGGQNLGEMTDVEYFLKKLYKSLNVPVARIEPDYSFNMGRATEISRDEVKFNKFVTRLRGRFNDLFLKTLEKQLVLKQVLTQDDWKEIAPKVKFDYAMDNYFAELKDIEVLNEKVNSYQTLLQTGAIGKYYSNKWVRKNIFRQDEEFMEQMDKEILEEQDNEIYNPPAEQQGDQPGDGQDQQGPGQQT
jgi:Bacteriophage T4-like portal protein (Gp20)